MLLVAFEAVCSIDASQEKKTTVAAPKSEYLRSDPGGDAASARQFSQRLHQRFVSMPRPGYPYEALRSRLEGAGHYRLIVDMAGKVTAVEVLKSAGHRMLDDAVQRTFRYWRAKPGPPLVVEMPVKFELDRAGRGSHSGNQRPLSADRQIYIPGPQVAPNNR